MDDPTVSITADPTLSIAGSGVAKTWQPGAPSTGTWGPLRLIEKVGQGSFGEVYHAFDTTLEREVALKLLLPRGQDPESETQSLLREARAMARIRHPNVVPVYGVATHDGRVGFWSDFVHGKTLAALLTTTSLQAQEALPSKSLFDLIQTGGWVMIPLGLASVLTVMLVLIYLVTLRRGAVVSREYMETAAALLKKRGL